MLTQLVTLKSRLAIDEFDVKNDTILTAALAALSARFDAETNRTLARTANLTHEFNADETEIRVPCFPIESVTKFELKSTEAEGWLDQTNVDYLIRRKCVISLPTPIFTLPSSIARVTYSGGYVLPGTIPAVGQTPLPADLEQAAVEQIVSWFQNRDKLGLTLHRPYQGLYQRFAQLDLLLNVAAVLKRYERWNS
jgi:hypothetical protein